MAPTYTQTPLTLPLLPRGSHLVTDHITKELAAELQPIRCGLLHLFLQHTSCALSLNENWDADVRRDMSDALDGLVEEDRGESFFFGFFDFLGVGGGGEGRGGLDIMCFLETLLDFAVYCCGFCDCLA